MSRCNAHNCKRRALPTIPFCGNCRNLIRQAVARYRADRSYRPRVGSSTHRVIAHIELADFGAYTPVHHSTDATLADSAVALRLAMDTDQYLADLDRMARSSAAGRTSPRARRRALQLLPTLAPEPTPMERDVLKLLASQPPGTWLSTREIRAVLNTSSGYTRAVLRTLRLQQHVESRPRAGRRDHEHKLRVWARAVSS